MDRIFHSFEQVDGDLQRQQGGTGLGLGAKYANDYDSDMIVSVTNEGRMLMFPLKELPRLANPHLAHPALGESATPRGEHGNNEARQQ